METATIERTIYIVEKEQVKSANTYVPIRIKSNWVHNVAERCIDAIDIIATIEGKDLEIPLMYKENTELKSRYLMGAFVKMYLLSDFEPCVDGDTALMSDTDYDKWAGGHVFSQIEKFKSDKDLRDICFNMLNDFKDLERRLNVECHALLNAKNDSVARQLVAMQASVSPEAVKQIMESVNEIKETAENIKLEEETKEEE